MINELTTEKDKVAMINLIKLINIQINNFFIRKSNNTINYDEYENIININGHWGSGKSTLVVNLQKYYLEEFNNDNVTFKVFNLWEYEIYDNPYLHILIDICFEIGILKDSKWLEKFKKILGMLLSIGVFATTIYASYLTGAFPTEISKKEKEPNTIEKLISERNVINKLIQTITEFINEKKKKFVIIFDELDRCNHQNATKILSHIKNIFLKISNIFYVLSSNNTVINDYIQKQIGSIKSQVKNEYYMDKIFNKSVNLEYALVKNSGTKLTENQYINEYINNLNITDLRMINKIMKQVNYIFESIKNDNSFIVNLSNQKEIKQKLELLVFYCCYVKQKFSREYSNILKAISPQFPNADSEFYFAILKHNKKSFDEKMKNKELFLKEYSKTIRNTDQLYNNLYLNADNNIGYKFALLMPFVWNLITLDNIDKIFQEYKNENNSTVLNYTFNINNTIAMSDVCKEFLNIIIKSFTISHESFLDDENEFLEEFIKRFNEKISLLNIKYLIEQTIIDIN